MEFDVTGDPAGWMTFFLILHYVSTRDAERLRTSLWKTTAVNLLFCLVTYTLVVAVGRLPG